MEFVIILKRSGPDERAATVERIQLLLEPFGGRLSPSFRSDEPRGEVPGDRRGRGSRARAVTAEEELIPGLPPPSHFFYVAGLELDEARVVMRRLQAEPELMALVHHTLLGPGPELADKGKRGGHPLASWD